MSATFTLQEYADEVIDLGPEDAHWLVDQTQGKFVIRRTLDGDRVIVNPQQFVGVMTLPSGIRLTIAPKVPAPNLFVMLATAFRLPSPFRQSAASFATLDQILEFLVDEFVRLVEDRVSAGLHRSYVEREENLTAVRGRIPIAEDMRRNLIERHHVFCRFTEFSWDIPENQIIRQVAHQLANWVTDPKRRLRLWQIDHLLVEVTPTAMPAHAIDRFVYTRQNDDYEPIHHLCRLFLEGSSVSEHAGNTPFNTFLLDMNRLFESFVTQVLHDRAPAGLRLEDQHTTTLDRDGYLAIRPDLLVSRNLGPVLVADCKYKRLDHEPFRHHDVYQVLAYCTAFGIDHGMLIYPRSERSVSGDLSIRNRGTVIRQIGLDLAGTPNDLQVACDELAAHVYRWAVA